jgi:hypothetical protein
MNSITRMSAFIFANGSRSESRQCRRRSRSVSAMIMVALHGGPTGVWHAMVGEHEGLTSGCFRTRIPGHLNRSDE